MLEHIHANFVGVVTIYIKATSNIVLKVSILKSQRRVPKTEKENPESLTKRLSRANSGHGGENPTVCRPDTAAFFITYRRVLSVDACVKQI